MPFLALLGPIKSVLGNKYVILGLIVAALYGYHYFTVQGLEKDINTVTKNYDDLKVTYEVNLQSNQQLIKDNEQLKRDNTITSSSYVKEIKTLKALIFDLEKKVVFKDKIIVKTVTKYLDNNTTVQECAIKVKKLDDNDSENSIIRLISNIGK